MVMIESIRAGRILDLPSKETISDGTAGGVEADSITFGLCHDLVDQLITVSEQEICETLIQFINLTGMLIEGAAAVAVASFLKVAPAYAGKNVVIVLCGGNIAASTLAKVMRVGASAP